MHRQVTRIANHPIAKKTAEQLELQALHRVRERLVSQRTGTMGARTAQAAMTERRFDRTIAVTTIARTPVSVFTGGWEPAERLAKHVLRILGIDFALPH